MKKTLGFTIVELITAIAIFALIATVAFVNIRGASPSREVQLQANNLASLLRQAQVQSSAGEPFNGASPIGGFGVFVAQCSTAPCSVVLFADVDASFTMDGGEEVQTVSLGSHVTIDTISTGAAVHVIFKPPRPFTCFDDVCSGINELTITLGSDKTAKTAPVVINQVSGQVSS